MVTFCEATSGTRNLSFTLHCPPTNDAQLDQGQPYVPGRLLQLICLHHFYRTIPCSRPGRELISLRFHAGVGMAELAARVGLLNLVLQIQLQTISLGRFDGVFGFFIFAVSQW